MHFCVVKKNMSADSVFGFMPKKGIYSFYLMQEDK